MAFILLGAGGAYSNRENIATDGEGNVIGRETELSGAQSIKAMTEDFDISVGVNDEGLKRRRRALRPGGRNGVMSLRVVRGDILSEIAVFRGQGGEGTLQAEVPGGRLIVQNQEKGRAGAVFVIGGAGDYYGVNGRRGREIQWVVPDTVEGVVRIYE